MQEVGAAASLDEEILAEERLDEQWELMLYNMSLRQTSQRAAGGHEGTHLLVSKIEANPAYRKMIERGLLECRYHMRGGDGASASATLLVTRKGLRYCVLFADEIEPRRAYDVAGVQRFQADDAPYAGGFGYTPTASDYAAITSGVASGKSAAKEAAWALTAEQVARLLRVFVRYHHNVHTSILILSARRMPPPPISSYRQQSCHRRRAPPGTQCSPRRL